MQDEFSGQVAILYPGDYEARQNATPENNRLASIFKAFAELGIDAEPAVYSDEFSEEVRQQLLRADVVLVWMNPIQDGRDRSTLDAMLLEHVTWNGGATHNCIRACNRFAESCQSASPKAKPAY